MAGVYLTSLVGVMRSMRVVHRTLWAGGYDGLWGYDGSGYARVSTGDQSLSLQIDALAKASCQKIYQEVASGARSRRPQLDDMLQNLRQGEVMMV